MAKRRAAAKRSARKGAGARRSGKRAAKATRRAATRKTGARQARARRSSSKSATKRASRKPQPIASTKPPRAAAARPDRPKLARLDRARRTLDDTVPTPPSSLDLDRHGSAARTGRRELEHELSEHHGATPAITGGDVDADWEQAYFSGDEAPGGDNPTPDQEVVDDIGKSLGVQYDDSEELKSTDKVSKRDKHRWELDPASSEDYKERK